MIHPNRSADSEFLFPGHDPDMFGALLDQVVGENGRIVAESAFEGARVQYGVFLQRNRNRTDPETAVLLLQDALDRINVKRAIEEATAIIAGQDIPDRDLLILFDCRQAGPDLKVNAYCYRDWMRPVLDRVLYEARDGQTAETVTLSKARLQTKPQGRPTDEVYDQAFGMIGENGGTEDALKKAFNWYCEIEGITYPTKHDRDKFRKAMIRRAEKT